jgi:hypothetical protein
LDIAPAVRESSRPSAPPAASTALAHWVAQARELGLPHQDTEPYIDGECVIPLVWRTHYAVAVLERLPPSVQSKLEDKGFEVHDFTVDASAWDAVFGRLRAALGRAS